MVLSLVSVVKQIRSQAGSSGRSLEISGDDFLETLELSRVDINDNDYDHRRRFCLTGCRCNGAR